jgi:hypothetical protein
MTTLIIKRSNVMHHEQIIEYVTHQPMTADQVLEKAAEILANRHLTSDAY